MAIATTRYRSFALTLLAAALLSAWTSQRKTGRCGKRGAAKNARQREGQRRLGAGAGEDFREPEAGADGREYLFGAGGRATGVELSVRPVGT